MDENHNHHLVPSLCIALDNSSERILASVRGFHLRRSAQLKVISEFLRFSLSDPEILSEISGSVQDVESSSPASRSEVFESFVNEQEKVKLALKAKLNQMMEHSRLIEAGITDERTVPFNIFLLADGKNTTGGGQLIPAIVLLLDLISKLDSVNLHILLNIASFPDIEKKSNDDLQVFTLVQELNEFTNSDSEFLKLICENLKSDIPPFDKASLYLFHHEKLEPGEITDNKTMEGMIGNSLLHLLSDNVAQGNARILKSSGLTFPITGLGSVLVAYDPEALQNYCAQKKTAEIIDTVILGEGLEGAAVMQASQLKKDLGDSEAWIKEVFRTLPDAVSQVIFEPESNEYKVILKEIKLEKIRYLEFKSLNWLDTIEDSETGVINNLVTASEATIGRNIDRLSQKWKEHLDEFAVSLPKLCELYPGGIDSAKKALFALQKMLLDEGHTINDRLAELEKRRKKPFEQLLRIQDRIKRIIENIPVLPKFISKIPEKYQELAAGLYYHLVYFLPIIRLRVSKGKYQELIEQIAGIDIQKIAEIKLNNALNSICKEDAVLSSWIRQLNRLEESIYSFRKELQDRIESTSFDGEGDWMEYFRVSMMDAEIARKIYNDHFRESDYIASELISNSKLFEDWQGDFEPISERLQIFSNKLFQDVWAFDLQDIHRMYGDLKKSEKSPLSHANLLRLFEITQPLLKPNFESRGDAEAISARYFLRGDNNWQDFELPSETSDNQSWEVIWTDDPYHLIVTQAIHRVGFQFLDGLFTEQQRKYQSLNEKEKTMLSTVRNRDYVTTISENDKEIIREYCWHFTPKGSNRTYSYAITLAIDLDRYRKYASEPRVRNIEEYNIYAQTEMPEISQLPLEFLKIFADTKWSTYNKAFCVLKFVQNAVKYAHDIDTKQKEEWPRYPIETLAEGVGDCEDFAILCASIMVRLGFDVVLLVYPEPCHMAFGVCGSPDMQGDYVFDEKTGKKYYYGEATSDRWLLGEVPKEYKTETPKFIKVELMVKEEDGDE